MLSKEVCLSLLWGCRLATHTGWVNPQVRPIFRQRRVGLLSDLLSVHLCRAAVVLGGGVIGGAAMLAEEGRRIGVTSDLHTSQLKPVPVGVELSGSDKAEVHSQRAMNARAVDAQKNSIWYTGPAGVLGSTVKARLAQKQTHNTLPS